MKRVIALLSIVLLLFTSCSGKSEPPRTKTADMLDITNTEKDFFGCTSRMKAVLSAMKAKVTVLENAHNTSKGQARSPSRKPTRLPVEIILFADRHQEKR